MGLHGSGGGPQEGHEALAFGPQEHRRPRGPGFYQTYGPEGTPIEELVRVCQERWAVEECFAEAKGEVGLDHYEVRRWDSWHRHITLSLLAHAFLVITPRGAIEEEVSTKKGVSIP